MLSFFAPKLLDNASSFYYNNIIKSDTMIFLRIATTLFILFLSFINVFSQVNEEKREWKLNPQIDRNTTEVFKVVEEMPRFAGCEEEEIDNKKKRLCTDQLLKAYVNKNVSFTKDENGKPLDYMAVVQFIVNKDGKTSDINLVRPINDCDACNEELLQIFDNSPKWIAGRQRGKLVDVLYTFPIKMRF